jgi:hypothetical protein
MSECWTNVHVYFETGQPLVRYRYDLDLPNGKRKRFWVRIKPRSQWKCHECGARRWAKNLRIHVYYDMSVITCAGGEHKIKRRRPLNEWAI